MIAAKKKVTGNTSFTGPPPIKRSKHAFEHRPVRALGHPGSGGNHGVTPSDLEERTVDVCVCTRCGTQVFTNQPTQARAVCNRKGLDCDAVIIDGVMRS